MIVANPTREELILIAGAHALFILPIIVARAASAKQRAIDLARFQELKRSP